MSPDRAPLRTPARAFLLSVFFLSGAVSLAYEVAWSRSLLLLLGSTATASAVVLGTFVGSLGLGARWAGGLVDRHPRPLRLYGLLEVGAAGWAVLAPLWVSALGGPYVALAAALPESLRLPLRILVAVIVIAPAAFLLGATLPAMVRHVVRGPDETGRQTAWLYGVNTVGAVAGCLGAGFVGIEALGVRGVVHVAAAVGALVGLAAILVGSRGEAAPTPAPARPATPAPRASWAARLAGVPMASRVALLCGFLGLAVEVVGFRILVYFLEGFTVTFAAMLAVFVAGLGVGSLLLGPALARTERPGRALGVLLLLQAAALLVGLGLVLPALEPWMRAVRDLAYAGARGPADVAGALRVSSLLGAAFLLFLPALLMGPTFPLCVRWAQLDGDETGEAVGRTYLFNSLGSLIAPLVATFLVVPLVHVTGAWVLATGLAAACGASLLRPARSERGQAAALTLAGLLGCAVALGALLLEIPGTRAEDLLRASAVLRDRPDRDLLVVRSDAVTTASVVETVEGERTLYTDEFAAAATGRHYRYMRLLGHLPALLAERPRNAMVIAFGTGTTAGAVARHAEVERLEVVEVSRAVLELADFFELANRGVLRDERVRVRVDDGRNALLLHEPDLDVVTLEPLMPYSPQGYPFYTREFYELARDRLREGGVLCQWVPVHAMPVGLYAAFLRAFFEVFPGGSLWFFEQSTALIGRKGAGEPDAETVLRRLLAVADDLEEAGFEEPWELLSGYVASGRAVLDLPPPPDHARFAGRPLTDLDPYPEFQPTPRAPLNTPYLHQTLQYLFSLVDPDALPLDHAWWRPEDGARLRRGTQTALAARWKEAEAQYLAVGAHGLAGAERSELEALVQRTREDAAMGYRKALADLPHDRVLRWRLVRAWRQLAAQRVRALLSQAAALIRAGEGSRAREALQLAESVARAVLPPALAEADALVTERAQAASLHAAVLLRLGRCREATRTLEAARQDLGERGAARLDALLAAVRAHERGDAVPGDPEDAWVLAEAAPCRAEGAAPVQAELDAFREALGRVDGRARRAAARRLVEAARREGVEEAVVGALPPWTPPGADPAAVLAAVAQRQLDPTHPALPGMLLLDLPEGTAGERTALRRLALVEAGAFGLLGSFPDAVAAAAGDPDPALRKALATAAAERGEPGVLRAVAPLLMDPDRDVRAEAFSVFLTHRPALVEGYDPQGAEAERRGIVERLEAALAGG